MEGFELGFCVTPTEDALGGFHLMVVVVGLNEYLFADLSQDKELWDP